MNTLKSTTSLFLLYISLFISVPLIAQQDSPFEMKPINADAFEIMRHFFNYDKNIPLDVHIIDHLDKPDYIREKIVFRGIRNSKVPGYLAIPKNGTAPYPCVILMHGISSSKESWWEDNSFNSGGQLTKQLLASGFAVLTLDAEYHGERLINNNFESPDVFLFQKGWFFRARDMIVQSVIEHRRAIDYLSTRSDINTSKIGIVGYSMGGMMVFNLSAVDPRVKVSIAAVTPILKESNSALGTHNFAPYVMNQPFLMLVGNTDNRNYSINEAQKLQDLISSNTKELVFYESGHRLPSDWTERTMKWLDKYLR